MIEIERKFLVDTNKLLSSVNLSGCKAYAIKQAYISIVDDIRVRRVEYKNYHQCFLTVKSDGSIERQEVENEIHQKVYDDLILNNMYKGNIIEKLRYEIPLANGFIAELDVYDKKLLGLIIVEVDFRGKMKDAEKFEIPDWFGMEVTENEYFKNKNLAFRGNPIKQ